MDIDDFRAEMEVLVPGPHPIADLLDTQDSAIRRGLALHGRQFPRRIVADLAGAGADEFDLSDLADWDDAFSRVEAVEYPAGEAPPALLEPAQFSVYPSPSGMALRLWEHSPAAGEAVRITHTAPHWADESGTSISETDAAGVYALCASCYADILAGKHAHNQDSTIGADSVNQNSKRRDFQAIAKAHMEFYRGFFGLDHGPRPAGGNIDWDWRNRDGRDRLTHPGWRR